MEQSANLIPRCSFKENRRCDMQTKSMHLQMEQFKGSFSKMSYKSEHRADGPTISASLKSLVCRNIISLSLFFKYYFVRCSSELRDLVPIPYSRGASFLYSNRLHDFCVTIPRCHKDVYVSSFFLRTARLWNYLPAECFPLTYDLNY